MTVCAGLSDSPASVIDKAPKCSRCSATTRLGNGLCLSCVMLEALETDRESSDKAFDLILQEAPAEPREWRLGNYEVLEEIGRGGMAVIYRARQRHSKRIVAIKRVQGYHADSRETLERFRREAEAAASLDHPHILPIYEVAEVEGVPFFSMKLALGGNLAQAARALAGRTREVVDLLAKVARGIEHAHGNGILHRDIKPGNILLDSSGEPLVSDFGLAKWLDAETDLTRTLTVFGTPGYIAPEQLNGRANLTPAADVYSLGAVLFDLLAGRPPFLGSHALSVLRQACEMPAPKLRSLSKVADRDLETICAKCLEREPSQRYTSAGAVAYDLERWLEGRPIVARRVLPSTRVWRWSRRNPQIIATAGVCLIIAIVAIWITGITARRSTPAKLPPRESYPSHEVSDSTQTKQLRAALVRYPALELQAWHASQPAAFSIDRARDSSFAQLATETKLRPQFVQMELANLAASFARRPDILSLEAAGAAYLRRDYVEAERFALQAADTAQQPSSEKVQALVIAGLAAARHQELARALEHVREAERLLDPQRAPQEWLNVEIVELYIRVQQNQFEELEKLARNVIDTSSRVFGPETIETTRTRSWLAFALSGQGRFAESVAEGREIVRLEEKALGSENPETITAIWALAVALIIADDEPGAEATHRRAYELRMKVLGPKHPDTLRSRNGLSTFLHDPEAALEEYREIARLEEKALGPSHVDTVRALLNVGFTLGFQLRRFDEAEIVIREVVARADRAFPAETGFPRDFLAYTHNALGLVLSEAGKYAQAEATQREALRLQEKTYGPEHPDTALSRGQLAFNLDAQGKHSEAEDQLHQAIAAEEKQPWQSTQLLVRLTTNLWYQGRFAEAEKEARHAIAAEEKELGAKAYSPDNNRGRMVAVQGPLFCRMLLANTLRDQQKYAEAEREYRSVFEQQEKIIGADDPYTLETYYNFAYQLAQQGRVREAKTFAKRAVEHAPKSYGPEHPYRLRFRALLTKIEAGEPMTLSDAKFRDSVARNDAVKKPAP